MLLALDTGNSDITIGLAEDQTWRHVWRMPSDVSQPELYYGIQLRDHLLELGIETRDISRVVISSVVPDLTAKLINITSSLLAVTPLVVGPPVYAMLPIKIMNPYEIGSDLVANALAAWHKYSGDCVVVDFGTALTFTVIQHNTIAGVAIAPGLKTSIKSLAQNTARLFDVPLELPESVLGKSTAHAIQSGILVGYEGLVRHMIDRIRDELSNKTLPVVATGGLSSIISSLHNVFDDIDSNLTLEGLRHISASIK